MLGDIVGFAVISKTPKTENTGTKNLHKYLTGHRLRVMEFADDGGVMVLAPDGTEFATFDACDVRAKFKCCANEQYIFPVTMKDDFIAQTMYTMKVNERKGGYAPILREMVIAASLHRGEFCDSVLWAKQDEDVRARPPATKTIEYGTVVNGTVLSATAKLITFEGENNEGYLLVGHGIKELPKEGEKGKITFTKNNGPTKGHWEYEKLYVHS